jgi:hypothetical protein
MAAIIAAKSTFPIADFFNTHRRLHSKPLPKGSMSEIAIYRQQSPWGRANPTAFIDLNVLCRKRGDR